jgi:hypothetical protein
MPTKDVRVRLSAEGQQEVVNAFRRVQQEAGKAKQSAVDATSGFNQLKDAAHSLALEFLGYTAAVEALSVIKEAVANSIEFAAGMEKLGEKTGVSAGTLQVFSAAAKRVDVDQAVVNKGLTLFAKAMGNAELGSTKASAAIKGLFGNVDALKGLTTEEKLLKITDALGKMEAGGKRTAIATALFGKSGAELLPVIEQLNSQGFDKMRQKLQDMGVLLSDDMVQSAHQAEEALGDLKLAGQGIATQFTAGFAPALASLAEGLASTAGGGASAFKELGREAGEAMKTAILWIGAVAIQLRSLGDKAIAVGKVIWEASPIAMAQEMLKNGKVKSLPEMWAGLKEDWQESGRNADAEIQALGDLVADKVQDVTTRLHKEVPDNTESEMTARAKAALARANLDFEKAQATEKLQLFMETNRLALEDEKERWKQGAESVGAYYQHRAALEKAAAEATQQGIAAEIAAEEKLLRTTKDPARRVEIEKSISELKTKAAIADLKATEIQTKLVTEQVDEYKKLAEEVLHFQDKLAEAQGKGHAAEIAAIDREAEKYRKELLQLGSADVEGKVAEFTKVMKAQADFKQAQKEAEESLRHLEEARKKIDDRAETGAISQMEKHRELIKLDKEELPALQALYAEMQKIATQSGLPALVKATEEFGVKVDEADAQLRKVKTSSKDVGEELNKSLGKDLNAFFTKGIFQAKNFGDAMRGLAMSITASMAQMFQQLLMKMIQAKLQAKLLGGEESGGGGGGFGGFLSGLLGAGGKAGGGEIHGPGTGTSDSVPIWASTGEFMVKAAVVRQPGIRELLHTLNAGLLTPRMARSRGPGFAQGGEVAAGGYVLGGKSGSAALTVGLDYGLVIKSLEAHPNFGRVIVRHLSDNRKAANAALGK